jgi:hypothetical protein
MPANVVDELTAIRDHLDAHNELVCAAYLQMAIDWLRAVRVVKA